MAAPGNPNNLDEDIASMASAYAALSAERAARPKSVRAGLGAIRNKRLGRMRQSTWPRCGS
jgi:hypothetical protein